VMRTAPLHLSYESANPPLLHAWLLLLLLPKKGDFITIPRYGELDRGGREHARDPRLVNDTGIQRNRISICHSV